MGKFSKYKKVYKKEWEKELTFRGWLAQDTADPERAYCKVCKTSLRAHKTDLANHSKKGKHINNFKMCNVEPNQSTISNVTTTNNYTKKKEMIIATYIAVHSNIRAVDHLSELMNTFTKKEHNTHQHAHVDLLRLHKTKCTMLIKNVIGATFKEDLALDVGNSFYSIIIDESTDISVCKYLCICIRYFSKAEKKIICNFMGLIELTVATAVVMAELIEDFITKIGLKPSNMVGLGTDGANVLCGKNHSVFTILKAKYPRLQLVKCVAHSLHLCCEQASEFLPDDIDFICKEIYNWFSRSSLRRASYKETFSLFNINEDVKFRNFMQLSETRWLARANVFKIILQQWWEIKSYFNLVQNEKKEKKCMAKILSRMLNNKNFLIMTVIFDIVIEVNKISGLFQHTNADLYKIYNELYQLLLNNLRIITKPIFLKDLEIMNQTNFIKIKGILDNPLALISLDIIDFGYNFREKLKECDIENDDLHFVKTTCRKFLIELCHQLVQRIPANINVFDSIKFFSAVFCLKIVDRPSFQSLPHHLLLDNIDKSILERQWNNLVSISWEVNNDTSTESFWNTVLHYRNAGGEHIFKEIAEFAIMVLSLPLSNAVVERVFSFMNIMKCKIRNKMNHSLLDALLRIKIHFLLKNKCCTNFEPTTKMFIKFNVNMYDHCACSKNIINDETKTGNENNEDTETDEIFEIFQDF